MKPLYRIVFLVLMAWLGWQHHAEASHAMGADLSYKCLGNGQYEVTLRFYRDCAGVSAPPSVTVSAVSGCTGQTVTANLQPFGQAFALEVTPLCPPLRQCSECNSNPPAQCPNPLFPGVEVYTYKGILTLPSQCPNWQVSYTLCCRNSRITNLQSPGGQSMHLQVLINNDNGLCNNSPDFTELPTPYICKNQPYNYNHGVIEPDGDSLVFELIPPMTTGGAAIGYVSPYTVNQPLSTLTGFSFNRKNGQLFLVPDQIQNAVTVVRVSEYRNGVLVGQTIRDIQVVVIDCPNNQIPPELTTYQNVGGGGYLIDSTTVGVCPNNLLTFDLIGTDGNTIDSVFLTSNFDTVFNNASYTVSGNNPTTGSFQWTPTLADVGTHFFVVTVKDNNCPVTSSNTYAFQIEVLDEVSAGPDQKYCTVGGPIRLNAKGGSVFSWRPTHSIISATPDSSTIWVAPTATTDYIVSSDCNREDTVRVEIVPSFVYGLTPSDTICRFETAPLNLSLAQNFGPYTINWSPDYKLDTNFVDSVISTPFYTTTYTVDVVSKDGCRVVDSVEVFIKGESPRVRLNADKFALCRDPNDQVQIEMFSTPSLCGTSPTGCNNNAQLIRVGDETNLTNIPTPYSGLYNYGRMQMLYTRQELNALGIFGGTIAEISFEVANKLSNQPYRDFTISIGCTEDERVTDEFLAGTQVVYGPTNVATQNGWNTYTLSNPYNWDGFTNLIVEVCFSNPNGGGPNSDFVFYTPTSAQTVLFRLSDNGGPGCDLSLPINSNRRTNTRFAICSQPTAGYIVNWSPSTGLNDPNSANPIISGLSQSTTYDIIIDNNGCISQEQLTIFVDSTTLTSGPDTLLCDTTDVWLIAQADGVPPDLELTCGINGTPLLSPPDTLAVDDGDLAVKSSMFQGNVTDMRYQTLYLGSDLRAAGLSSGTITELALQLGQKNTIRGVDNFTIKLSCTNINTLDRNQFENLSDIVFQSPQYDSKPGWNQFVLDSPFDWDGQSNLVLEICWDNPDNVFIGSIDEIYVSNVSYDGVLRGYGVNTVGCDIQTPNVAYKERPNIRFHIVNPPPGEFEYTWEPIDPAGPVVLNDSMRVSPRVTTTYQVSTETKFGCLIFDTVTVTVDLLNTSIAADTAICAGDLALLFASGGDTYSWNPTDITWTDPNGDTSVLRPSATQTYTVTIINSASGCTVEREVTVTVHPLPIADAGDTTTILIGSPYTLTGSGGIQYFWTPDYRISDPTLPNPVVTPLQNTTYTLLVTDENGCQDLDTVRIFVESIDDVFIPSAFSPNGDGQNDVFQLVPYGLTDLESFQIFNRWGQLVFQAGALTDGWDGTVNGEPQPMGTYIYYLTGFDYKGDPIQRQGNLTLLR